MPVPVDEACNNCQFFMPVLTPNPETVQCMRYPPQFSYGQAMGYQDPTKSMVWPVTRTTRWCGEWQHS